MSARYTLAIASFVRDEARFLREWLEYHFLVGVEHAYLLCNDPPATAEHAATAALLGAYAARGLVTWEPLAVRQTGWQLPGWYRLLELAGRDAKWLCMTDSDAFLYPVEGDSVVPLVERYDRPDVAVLAVYVATFGSSGLEETPPLQLEAFCRRAPLEAAPNWTANYIVRPDRIAPSRKAYAVPQPGYHTVDTAGAVLEAKPGKRQGPLDVLRLNHYSVRSRADFLRKVRRGWEDDWDAAATWHDPARPLARHKRAMLDRNEVLDRGMLRFVPALKARLARSLEAP